MDMFSDFPNYLHAWQLVVNLKHLETTESSQTESPFANSLITPMVGWRGGPPQVLAVVDIGIVGGDNAASFVETNVQNGELLR